MNTIPILISQSCVLSPIKKDDLDDLYQIMIEEDVKKYLPEFYEIIESKEDFISVMNSFAILWEKREAIIWGIYHRKKLVGFIGILDIPEKPTILYTIDKAYRGIGIAKDAVARVICYLEESDAMTKLFSEVFEDNYASIAVLKFNGFAETGRTENNKILFIRKS